MLAVPGNHDIPYTFPARFTAPWREFERQWQTTEPELDPGSTPTSSASTRCGPGGTSRAASATRSSNASRAGSGTRAPGALRVVALHHQLIGAPWRSRKKPVAHRGHVLARLVDSGAELIVGGHIHQATVSERHEFEVITGERARCRRLDRARARTAATAAPRARRAAASSTSADERSLVVDTYIWRGDDWGLTATRRFARGREPLAVER